MLSAFDDAGSPFDLVNLTKMRPDTQFGLCGWKMCACLMLIEFDYNMYVTFRAKSIHFRADLMASNLIYIRMISAVGAYAIRHPCHPTGNG